jgi:DNA-binding NarL/FixJ family response regulator
VLDTKQQIAPDRTRVLIVDDQAGVRRALRFFVLAFEDLELVGEASSYQDALELCAQTGADVVLMDLMAPGMNAASAIRILRRCCPKTRVIALSSFWTEEQIRGALQAGAVSYLLKNVSADELADAIRTAHAGRSKRWRETPSLAAPCPRQTMVSSPPEAGVDADDCEDGQAQDQLVAGDCVSSVRNIRSRSGVASPPGHTVGDGPYR